MKNPAKATFLLPLRDNEDRDLVDEIAAVQKELALQFSGWTQDAIVKGAYRMDDGSESLDRSARYLVILEEDRVGEVEAILLQFEKAAAQERIYWEVQHNVDIRWL